MEATIGIVILLVVGYGVSRFLKSRAKAKADREARAAKRAKVARDDAKALKRALDGRR